MMMTHWYNSDSRANMISSYREWRDLMEENDMWEERSKHIESCSGADTYQAHMIYNTHNVVYDKQFLYQSKKGAYAPFLFYNTFLCAGVVLTASTIAFQAIGTGSNPVTRSNNFNFF